MTSCFAWLLLIGFAIFMMVTLIRWFDVVTEAVDHKEWARVAILVLIPLTAWRYESKLSSGRPGFIARHQPVMGFGDVAAKPPPPKKKKKAGIDPEAIAKLKAKMQQQGMLDEEESEGEDGR